MSDNLIAQGFSRHLRTLAVCWIIYGVLRLAAALWLAFFSNTATLMFGALLNRVGDSFTLMGIFHFVYTLVIILSTICGVLGILAGLALLASRSSGRTLTLLVAFLSLSDIPLGTTLGIYSLIVLLPLGSQRSAVLADGRAPNREGHPSETLPHSYAR